MLTHPITDPRAWRADTLDEQRSWYYRLSDDCLAAMNKTIRRLRESPAATTQLSAFAELCMACVDELGSVRAALARGPGFAIIRLPPGGWDTPQDLPRAYWLIGQLLGHPVAQDIQGTLLYDVRDTGRDVYSGARFSVTNAESSFHTDNSFGSDIVDYVGLLCLRTAQRGGLSQIVSGYTVHNELLARHSEALGILYRSWHIDRRGGVRPGDSPTVQFPILSWDEGELTYRYLRFWIEAGHEKVNQALSVRQRQALDALDEVLNQRPLRAEFALEPGDAYFINNRWILHNRTAFEDYAEPEQRRHLIRLWLRAAGPHR
jgi:alpha-ketoglutarate-dependent taurine dioxygenase